MMSTTDELAVRAALADLVESQPDAPVDRVDGVRRLHVRRRRVQTVTAAACAALAIIGVGVGLGLRSGTSSVAPAHRDVPSWALPWPEHRDASVPQSVLDGAVRAWSQRTYGDPVPPALFDPRQVVWYVAEPVLDRSRIAVVFELERDDGERRLVAGTLSDPANPHDASYWVLYDAPAPDPHDRSLVVSFYLTRFVADAPDNSVLVLTDPAHHDIGVGVPERPSMVAGLADGFGVLPYGALRQQLRLSLSASGDVPVGLAGDPDSQVPALEQPAPLVGVPQTNSLDNAAGQGDAVDVNGSPPADHGRTVIFARCYGGPSLTVTVDSQSRAAVTIPCDDRQHRVDGPALVPGGDTNYDGGGPGHSTEIAAGKLVAWRVAVVVR